MNRRKRRNTRVLLVALAAAILCGGGAVRQLAAADSGSAVVGLGDSENGNQGSGNVGGGGSGSSGSRDRYSSGKSGRGSGGASFRADSDRSSGSAIETQDVTRAQAAQLAKDAVAGGGERVTGRLINRSSISLENLRLLSEEAQKAGKSITLYSDMVSGSTLKFRMALDPAEATRDIGLYLTDSEQEAAKIYEGFRKFYSNKIVVIRTGQSGGYGCDVRIAAKISLEGMDRENLVFYSYNAASNSYTRIPDPGYAIDENGFLHFTTSLADDIIISSGELAVK